ncbi:hypothetical protein CF336_g9594, partial [Tilletia laevis]
MAWGTTAPPSADLKDRSAPSSHGWTPTIQDPLAKAFPWASLTVFGSPLPNVSTSFVRQQLQARRGSRRPKWPQQPGSTLDDAAWKGIWTLLRRLPLSAIVRTTSVLILNKNVWTYHDKEGDGNRRCPAGCGGEDGVNHGYFECPGAVAVWEECLPLLTALGCPTPTNFSASGILRCDGVPPPMRPRFGLWMAVVSLQICSHRRGNECSKPRLRIALMRSRTSTRYGFAVALFFGSTMTNSSFPQYRLDLYRLQQPRRAFESCSAVHLEGVALRRARQAFVVVARMTGM